MIARRRSLTSLIALLATMAGLFAAHATAASAVPVFGYDTSFGKDGLAYGKAPPKAGYFVVNAVAPRPGGGWVAVGYMGGDPEGDDYDSDWNWMISAFRADGSPDRKFGSNGRVINSDPGGYARNLGSTADVVAVQPDGKILVGGVVDVATAQDQDEYLDDVGGDPECNCFGGRAAFRVARYRTDGKVDRTFGNRGNTLMRGVTKDWVENGGGATMRQLVVGKSGRIFVVGETRYFEGDPNRNFDPNRLISFGLRRNGTIDRGFGRNGRMMALIGRRTANFFPLRAVALKRGGFAIAGRTELYRGKPARRSRLVTVHVTAGGRLDRSFSARGWREVSFAGKKWDFDAVDMRPDGSSVFLMHRHVKGSYTGPSGNGAIVVSITKRGYRDTEFGEKGILDLVKAVGRDQMDGEWIVALKDGSMAVLTTNGLSQQYSDDPDPNTESLIAISKHGIDGPAMPFEFQMPADAEVGSAVMATDGSGVVFGGSLTTNERDHVFFTRLKRIGT